ncbi:PqiC family protein [Eoetvoesiella caeni]
MNICKLFFGLIAVAGLAGCAAPPASQYYTLMPASKAATPQTLHNGKYAIRVLPVSVPEQVDRPQIVLGTPNSAEVTLLNGSLWASPLSDEIRQALSSELSAQLGVLSIPAGPVPDKLALWRIGVTVQRFDSLYGRHALLDASWRLEQQGREDGSLKLCRTVLQVPVAEGVAPMVEGQRLAVQYLAATIAAQLSEKKLDVPAGRIIINGCA